jgi:anti-sigma regulatory factor (Ser/Thr protein kinase)
VTADVLARGVPTGRSAAVELAIHELLANALEHGHLGDPAVPIEVEVTGAAAGAVTVRITDRALGGGWTVRRPDHPAPATRSRGRGLVLARSAVTTLEVVEEGARTEVVVRVSTLPPPGAGAG